VETFEKTPTCAKLAGVLIQNIREACGISVKGVIFKGRPYLDATDPVAEKAAESPDAVAWFVSRIDLTRPPFQLEEEWRIVSIDPPA
jgi:hypothetical protein